MADSASTQGLTGQDYAELQEVFHHLTAANDPRASQLGKFLSATGYAPTPSATGLANQALRGSGISVAPIQRPQPNMPLPSRLTQAAEAYIPAVAEGVSHLVPAGAVPPGGPPIQNPIQELRQMKEGIAQPFRDIGAGYGASGAGQLAAMGTTALVGNEVLGAQARGAAEALPGAAESALDTAKAGANVARQAAVGPKPADLTPTEAFIKATKPRNSIKNITDSVDTALPDARRAADSLGIDPKTMTLSDAERAVVQAKKDVWQEFENRFLGPNRQLEVPVNSVGLRIQATGNRMTAIQRGRMPQVVQDIKDAASDYAGQQMPIQTVEARIQELNNELRSQQAQYKVNEMDLRRDPRYAPKFAELDALRQVESDAFQRLSGPGAADLKQRYGSLKTLEDVISRRIPVVERQNPASLYETVGRMAGAGDIVKGILAREPSQIAAGAVKIRQGQYAQMLNDPDVLIQHAFSSTTPSAAPPIPEIKGVPLGLPPGPRPMGAAPDTSGSVPFTPPAYQPTTRAQRLGLMLPESTSIPLGPVPVEQGGVFPAASKVVRDPRTGRMVRQYITSPKKP